MTRVIGLDISLTSTGFADALMEPHYSSHYELRSRAVETSPVNANPTLRDRQERSRAVELRIAEMVFDGGPVPALVVVEAPAYGAKFGDPHDRSGLWWGIVDRLMNNGLHVVEVSPGQVKQYATGSGATHGANKVSKAMVVKAVNDRYDVGPIRLRVADNDRADAIVLAAMGARILGCPIDPHIPPANLRAITKIRLPEGIRAS